MTVTAKSTDISRQKERSKHSISLVNFGQRKGQVRALEEFRHRKEKKRLETAKVLRKYKKSMKSEGYEAGRGAARKREPKMDNTENENEESADKKAGRRKRFNPLLKSVAKARQNKEEAEKRAKRMEENLKDKEKKLRERKRVSKLLAKRSKRGQPIMKHTVENILKKLERQNTNDESK